MGSVYLARDLDLERDVAIKFIAAERAGDSAAQRRLIHEARAAAALDHPNICAVHDVIVEADGRACIVMQYVEGETLSARLERGALDPRQAFLFATDIASALGAAHKRGIIHRDIKPQNIIITPAGKAKLLDFGIARLDALVPSETGTTALRLTGPGHLVGTPMYMSPEQVQQLPLDGRSDLFSLGAVIYECLTGRRAFDARTDAEVYVQILRDHPRAVSSLRQHLSAREDELCRRLLAKDPNDRFASADELLGALRVLAPDTALPSGTGPRARPNITATRWRSRFAAALVILITAAVGLWQWQRPEALPAPPADAERWYVTGTEAIRNGSYHSARLALQEAIDSFPAYVLAHARIAEAHAELDEHDAAMKALLRVDELVDDQSRLAVEDRLRLDAVRSIIIGKPPAAIDAYTKLAARLPADAGILLDLGRAQEIAALPVDARASYERAIAVDRHYAAAHLRRGGVLSQQGRRDEALNEFDEAERLYRAASNVEGETEALLRRGTFLAGSGKFADARTALERAKALAMNIDSRPQEIRAQLRLSSVIAWEGQFSQAAQLAAAAVDAALQSGLDSVAADGLIELGTTLTRVRNYEQADAQLIRAIQLAEKRGAQRLLARARLQRASMMLVTNRPADALALAESSVRFMHERGYRRHELQGLSIVSRAHLQLEQYDRARPLAEQGLRVAEELKDQAQVGEALENLAALSTDIGALPEALAFRERLEAIHRAQQNVSALAFDLTHRADLLVRLGRPEEANRVLDEIDAGIAKGVDAYIARARRASLVRALAATCAQRFDVAGREAAAVNSGSAQQDSTAMFAAALLTNAEARLGRRAAHALPAIAGRSRELRYWEISARLAAGDARGAADAVVAELTQPQPSYELEWRLAALGAAAARRARLDDTAQGLERRALEALQRLRNAWREHARSYEMRPDVAQLLRDASLKTVMKGN